MYSLCMQAAQARPSHLCLSMQYVEKISCSHALEIFAFKNILNLYLTETHFSTFANRVNPDQSSPVRVVLS